MPSEAEFNQFRRLIGDYEAQALPDSEVEQILNDTCWELTSDFATPVTSFDALTDQYHTEIVYKAAINWWWNRLSDYADNKHSVTIGSASQNVGEKWDRGWQMIQNLQNTYDQIQSLRIDIYIGNYSRFSKQTLRRIGGVREEDTYK